MARINVCIQIILRDSSTFAMRMCHVLNIQLNWYKWIISSLLYCTLSKTYYESNKSVLSASATVPLNRSVSEALFAYILRNNVHKHSFYAVACKVFSNYKGLVDFYGVIIFWPPTQQTKPTDQQQQKN